MVKPRPTLAVILPVAAVMLAASPVAAAPGFAVCMAVDDGAEGRVVATVQPFAADSGRAEGEATGFARAARAQGKVQGALEPACHWEPSRDKAADYLRRLRQGAGRKGADAAVVDYAPAS